MDILLTGATGFVGQHLVSNLAKKHRLYAITHQDDAIDRNDTSYISWIVGDLSQINSNMHLPDNIDSIVYLAQSNNYRNFPDSIWDIFNINTSSVLTLLEYARQKKIKKFIYASTANVYELSHYPITEIHNLDMNSFYAYSKRMGELLVEYYSSFFRTVIFRFFTVYGPNQKGMLIPSLIEKIENNLPIQLIGSKHGLELSPIFVSDVTKVISTVLDKHEDKCGFDIFNVGGDERISIRDMAFFIGNNLNKMPIFEFIPGEYKGGWIADNSKLKKEYTLGKFITFEHGISQIINGDG